MKKEKTENKKVDLKKLGTGLAIGFTVITALTTTIVMTGCNDKTATQTPTGPQTQTNPSNPQTPTTPENPTTPGNPTTPEDPTTPENPTTPEKPVYETHLEEIRAKFTDAFKDSVQGTKPSDRTEDEINFNQIEEIINIYQGDNQSIVVHCNYTLNEKDENGQNVTNTYNGFIEFRSNRKTPDASNLDAILSFVDSSSIKVEIYGQSTLQSFDKQEDIIKKISGSYIEENYEGGALC